MVGKGKAKRREKCVLSRACRAQPMAFCLQQLLAESFVRFSASSFLLSPLSAILRFFSPHSFPFGRAIPIPRRSLVPRLPLIDRPEAQLHWPLANASELQQQQPLFLFLLSFFLHLFSRFHILFSSCRRYAFLRFFPALASLLFLVEKQPHSSKAAGHSYYSTNSRRPPDFHRPNPKSILINSRVF